MDRNFYYVGIAFFGMINGLFNQALVPFAYLFATILAPGSCSATSPSRCCLPP